MVQPETYACAHALRAVQGVRCDAVVDSAHSVLGAGMVATVEDRHVAAGTAALLASRGVAGPEVAAAQLAIDAEGVYYNVVRAGLLTWGGCVSTSVGC